MRIKQIIYVSNEYFLINNRKRILNKLWTNSFYTVDFYLNENNLKQQSIFYTDSIENNFVYKKEKTISALLINYLISLLN